MSFFRLIQSSRTALAAGLGLLMVSCSTAQKGNGVTITKVNPYRLPNYAVQIPPSDPSIAFERDSILHGAISSAERLARQGDYFTIFWTAADRSEPVVVRLEYTQQKTGLKLKKVEQEVTDVRRSNSTKFNFIGDDYVQNGPVTSWRASILRGKETLVDYKSYLWK
ncbi:MAG: hypothetical protein ACOYMN_13090 [Roseimicrobium sp.]